MKKERVTLRRVLAVLCAVTMFVTFFPSFFFSGIYAEEGQDAEKATETSVSEDNGTEEKAAAEEQSESTKEAAETKEKTAEETTEQKESGANAEKADSDKEKAEAKKAEEKTFKAEFNLIEDYGNFRKIDAVESDKDGIVTLPKKPEARAETYSSEGKEYYFTGWEYKGKEYEPGDKVKLKSDAVFKAVWKQTYTIEFSTKGIEADEIEAQTEVYGEDVVLPEEEASEDGYDFTGWTADGGKTVLEAGETISASVMDAVAKKASNGVVTLNASTEDITPPEISISVKDADEGTWEITATDVSGIKKIGYKNSADDDYTYTYESEDASETEASITVGPFTAGSTLYVVAYDGSDEENEGTSEQVISSVLESDAPEIEMSTTDSTGKAKTHYFKLKVDDFINSKTSYLRSIKITVGGKLIADEITFDQNDSTKEYEAEKIVIPGDGYTLDGNAEVVVTATDWCNNTSTSAAMNMSFDNEAPTVTSLSMADLAEGAEEGYYNADNAKVTVGVEDASSVSSVTIGGIDASKNSDGSWTADLSGLTEGTVTFSVVTEDSLGNEGTATLPATISGATRVSDTKASFILDNTAPEAKVTYSSEATPYFYDEGAGESPDYKVYLNQAVTATVEITTEEEDYSLFSVNNNAMNSSKKEDVPVISEEGEAALSFGGTDKAGNPVVVSEVMDNVEEKSGSWPTDTVEREEESDLQISFIVDNTNPTATVTYSSEATPYFYDEGAEESPDHKVYLNQSVTATVEITTEGEDYSLFSVNNNAMNSSKKEDVPVISEEGEAALSFGGTDKAGNPVVVSEVMDNVEEKSGSWPTDTVEREEESDLQISFIIDTTAPTYTMTFNEPVYQDGSVAFYNYEEDSEKESYEGAKATVVFSDANADKTRLFAGIAELSDPEFYDDTEFTTWTDPNTNPDDKLTVNLSVTEDGVYRFAVYGEDKAGNKLSGSDSADNSYANKLSDAKEGQYWSKNKVVDTTVPSMTLTAEDTEEFYNWCVAGDGEETLTTYEPFRKSTSAVIEIDGADKSPIKVSYEIVWIDEDSSVAGTEDQNWDTRECNMEGETEDYEYNAGTGEIKVSDNGKNIEFRVRNITITDRSGNTNGPLTSNTVYLDTVPDGDTVSPVVSVEPILTGDEAPKYGRYEDSDTGLGRDFYRDSVSFKISAYDPNKYKSSSGLKSITYKVKVDGTDKTEKVNQSKGKAGTLLDRENDREENDSEGVKKNGDAALLYSFDNVKDEEITVTVPKGDNYNGTFESNDIVIYVKSTDNAGNTKTVQYSFGIDSHGPRISVKWNTPLSGVRGGKYAKYYNFDRTATIKVVEQNFDKSAMKIKTQVTPKGWSSPSGDGRESSRTNDCEYDKDGDYSLAVSGADILGNEAELIEYEDGDNHGDFTIDKTNPVIKVTFDNNSVRNKKYYKANRTATVTVTEHNFAQSDVDLKGTAKTLRDGKLSFPSISSFSKSSDVHKATLPFTKEGKFNFSVDFIDLAGNKAKQVVIDEFDIDKTAPVVKIENVDNNGIYGGTVAPKAVYEDDTFSKSDSSFKFSGVASGNRSDLIPGFKANGSYGGSYTMNDFPHIRNNDDWYTATATSTDMAGNTTTVTKTFSVNRFGSSFDYNGDTATIGLVAIDGGRYYTNTPQTLQLGETNVNPLESYEVTLDRGGSSVKLQEGTDFTVSKNEGDRGSRYVYKFSEALFTDEGTYNIIVRSVDTAGNTNTNAAVRSEDKDTSVPVKFMYDVTEPDINFLNMDDNESRIEDLKVKRKYSKNGVSVFELGINPDDLSGSPITYVSYKLGDEAEDEYYNDETQNITKLKDNTSEDGTIVITVPVKSSVRTQHLDLTIKDAAGNEFTTEVPYKLTITNNVFQLMLHFWYWILLLLLAIAGGIYAYKRSRSDEEKEY